MIDEPPLIAFERAVPDRAGEIKRNKLDNSYTTLIFFCAEVGRHFPYGSRTPVRRCPQHVRLSLNLRHDVAAPRTTFRANTGSQADPFDERVGVDKIRNGLASSALGHA